MATAFSQLAVLVTVTALITAAYSASAVAGSYDPLLTAVISSDATLTTLAGPAQASSAVNANNLTALASDGGLAFFLSAFQHPALQGQNGVIPLVAGVMPLCIAHNAPSDVAVTLAALSAILNGGAANVTDLSSTGSTATLLGNTSSFSSITLPSASSGMGAAFVRAMNAASAPLFSSSSAYPASVTSNAAVTFVGTEAEVISAVRGGAWGLGVTTVLTAVANGLRCARIRIPQSQYDNILPAAVVPDFIAKYKISHSTVTAFIASAANLVYPLAGPIVLYLSSRTACDTTLDDTSRRMADAFYRQLTFSARTSFVSVRSSAVATTDAYAARLLAPCSPAVPVTCGGSSALYTVMIPWAQQYEGLDSTALVRYASTGSGVGVSGALTGSYLFGGSEAPLTAALRAQKSSVVQLPVVALSIALVFNLPQQCVNLHLPRCLVPAIFNGSVTSWDDSRLQAVNPSLSLPRMPIRIVVRSDASGSTQVFLGGLQQLEQECWGGSNIVPGESWIFSNNVTAASGGGGVASAVAANYFTLGYVALPTAISTGLSYADLVDESTGATAKNDVSLVATALAVRGRLDSSSLTLTQVTDKSTYVFVGSTYVMIDTAKSGNCTAMKYAFDFLRWAMVSDVAQSLSRSLNYVPVPANLLGPVLAAIDNAQCNGAALYPAAETSTMGRTIGIACGVVGGFLLAVSLWRLKRVGQRDNDRAPKDPYRALAMVFTDIQASTTLWSGVPEHMATALDAHNDIMREVLDRHNGYEVKTIGDAFMIAFAEAEDAVRFALDVQTALYKHDWGTRAIDDIYDEMIAASGATIPVGHDDPALWNGLRVRIGVHYGTCEIHEDPVTKGYDYHGTLVNTAARVEDAGHGGQVVVTSSVLEALDDEYKRKLVIRNIGPTALRGLLEDVHLSEVCTPAFVGRTFPPLRTDHAPKDINEEGGEVASISGTQSDVMSQMSMGAIKSFPVSSVLEALLAPMKPAERDATLKKFLTTLRIGIKKDATTDQKRNRLAGKLSEILSARVSHLQRRASALMLGASGMIQSFRQHGAAPHPGNALLSPAVDHVMAMSTKSAELALSGLRSPSSSQNK